MEISDDTAATVLMLVSIALPYLVFAIHNSYRNKWLTLVRAFIAVITGWLFVVAYLIASDAISRKNAVPGDVSQHINDGDGAKFAFAAVFGWVMPSVVVFLGWLIHRVVIPKLAKSCRERMGS